MSAHEVGLPASSGPSSTRPVTALFFYVAWDEHLMFAAPIGVALTPALPFAALIEDILPQRFGGHPDFARINWTRARWFKGNQPWWPDPTRSLHENGLRHRDVLRLRTPGLHGIGGSAS